MKKYESKFLTEGDKKSEYKSSIKNWMDSNSNEAEKLEGWIKIMRDDLEIDNDKDMKIFMDELFKQLKLSK